MSWVELRGEERGKRGEAATFALPSFLFPLSSVSIAVLAFLASAASLRNGFVYDDGPIVEANARVHTLARAWQIFAQPYWPPGWGDANYRPLTILSFALQWALGGGSPVVFHATNVVLYLAVCVAVFSLARLVLPTSVAWLVAALFAVHPVHVEAVGNVVGQAEIVVALCSTLAVAAYIRLRTADRGLSSRATAWIAVAYAVACLSKETGFFLPGLLLVAELTVVSARLDPGRARARARAAETWPLYVACGGVGIAYLAIRHAVLGNFGDDPNPVVAVLDAKTRLLTMLGVVPEWARLLVWPARLAADYSPPGIPLFPEFTLALIPAVALLAGCVALCAADRQGRRVAAFGIAWALVALFPVSNLVLRSGVILAERTLFLPSVGAMLGAGAGAAWLAARRAASGREPWPPAGIALVALVLVLGVVRSAERQRVWRSNDDFFAVVADDAPRGYRAHYMHGMWLLERGRRQEGERHVRTAIALFPYDPSPYTDLADQYRKSGFCAPARQLYRRAMAVGPMRAAPRIGLVACLLQDGEFAEAKNEALRGVERGGAAAGRFRQLVAVADSALATQDHPVTLSGAPRTDAGQKGPRD